MIVWFVHKIVPLHYMFPQSSRNNAKRNGSRSLRERVTSIFLLVIWIFPFFSNSFAFKAYPDNLNKSTLNAHINGLLSADVDSSTPHPFDPNLPDSTPQKQDEFDENEKEDNSEDDWKILCRTSLQYSTSLEKALTAGNTQSIQNRNSVYLFILFHSWKIFLA